MSPEKLTFQLFASFHARTSRRRNTATSSCPYGISLSGLSLCLSGLLNQQMEVMLAQGSPFALTNLSISAGYFPDDDSITISLNIGADVNFIDVIGQLVSNVC
jgi:hypothetical protein